jgi:hypothetical protein
MSVAPAKIKSLQKKGQLMPKPRMTKSEKAFVESVHKIVFATPEIRNGVSYLDRKAWATLSADNQKRYLHLAIDKTR